MTDFVDSYLHADRVANANPGLTAEQIRSMPMADFARLMGREPLHPTLPTPAPAPGPTPQVETTRTDELEPEPISVRDMTPEQYAEFRKSIGMGQSSQYGVGIFNSVSAPKASNGRHFMVNSNVEKHPGIARVSQVQINEGNLDRRPLAERFGNPSNAFRYE